MDEVKVVLVGNNQVHGNELLAVYALGKQPEDGEDGDGNETTSEVVNHYQAGVLVEGEPVKLELWGANGDEIPRLRRLMYQDACVILVCFSISDRQSFIDVRTKWHPELRQHAPLVPSILVGVDPGARKDAELVEKLQGESKPIVSEEEAQNLATRINAKDYLECSITDRETLEAVFQAAARIGVVVSIAMQEEEDGEETTKPRSGSTCQVS